MGRKAGWWDNTWNPVAGCKAVSEGCLNCYAATQAATLHVERRIWLYEALTRWLRGRPIFNGRRKVLPPWHPAWRWPLTWKGDTHPNLGPGQPSLIFVCDMCDLFYHERPVIDRVVRTVAHSPHIGLIQTRYAGAMAGYFRQPTVDRMKGWRRKFWLGFSAENQKWFDARWRRMRPLAEAGWLVYVVVAPMLGPVRLPADFLAFGGRVWVIVSGERHRDHHGRPPRPMDSNWARALRDQCREAGTPYFFNQMSGLAQIPEDLRIWEFPEVVK
ncbi:MAG TPA: DUF5131 family protein [Pseudolabrys sp.]|nr:DUF5131 family protein [Pseudolabrys sp.]